MTSYRILERQTARGWVPFAVAYQRGGRTVLFAPPWRALRPLDAASVEELGEEHFPAGQGPYRWTDVRSRARGFEHPIEILQEELETRVEEAAEAPGEPETPPADAGADETESGRLPWRELIQRLKALLPADIGS